MKENVLDIALVKEACPLCAKTEDGPIIMNSILTTDRAKKVEELNGKVIGMMDKPCSECQELMKQGILLIGVIDSKSNDHVNPYRSGNQWVVSEEFVRKSFDSKSAEAVVKKGASFFSVEAAHKMGFPECNLKA